MIMAKAKLIAGDNHVSYPNGKQCPAVFFVVADSDQEAEKIAATELLSLGWESLTIERFKDVIDYSQFEGKDSPEAFAFRNAQSVGFGVVVYP